MLINFSSNYLVNLSRKTIRFGQYINYYAYRVFRKRIDDYPSPPDNLKEIGCFDLNLLVCTPVKYQRYFDSNNLSDISDNTPKYKDNSITLILDDCNILIKKSFSGVRKFSNFYTELICYNEIRHLDISPEIQYVDYEKATIYMEYIDGVCLTRRRKNIYEITRKNKDIIHDGFLSIMNLLHSHGIIFHDMGGMNFVMKGDRVYIFDFSDSIFFSRAFLSLKPVKKVFQKLAEQEKRKVYSALNYLGITEN